MLNIRNKSFAMMECIEAGIDKWRIVNLPLFLWFLFVLAVLSCLSGP